MCSAIAEGTEEKEGEFLTILGRRERRGQPALEDPPYSLFKHIYQCLFLPCPLSTCEGQSPRFRMHPIGQGGGRVTEGSGEAMM